MAILDFWSNPLGSVTADAIGYRGDLDEFPHDLYSFLLSTIRDADQDDISLLYRWMRPMQQFWEQQYSAILSVPDLYSPENCASELLDHLRKNIGILDDLSYLWGVLTENDKRKLIKYFIRFLVYRGTNFGLTEMIETMSGYPIELRGYFYYRWLLSGDNDLEIETSIGRENLDGDPWLISEVEVPVGIAPDAIYTGTNPNNGLTFYLFTVNTLVEAVTNLPVPDSVQIRCRITGETIEGPLTKIGDDYYVKLPDGYLFEQSLLSITTSISSFRIGFEIDQYVSDILVVDDGELNHAMIQGLARFSRPISERIYIRYYNLIEDFELDERWAVQSGTVVHDETAKTVLLNHAANSTEYELDYLDSANWIDYSLNVKAQSQVVAIDSEIRFMYQDSSNYYYLKIVPGTPPVLPAGVLTLGHVVAGADTVLTAVNTDWLDINVDYVWRIDCFSSTRPGGDVQIIRVYQDENIMIENVDDPQLWVNTFGTIQLVVAATGQWLVDQISVHPLPMISEYVGPTI